MICFIQLDLGCYFRAALLEHMPLLDHSKCRNVMEDHEVPDEDLLITNNIDSEETVLPPQTEVCVLVQSHRLGIYQFISECCRCNNKSNCQTDIPTTYTLEKSF